MNLGLPIDLEETFGLTRDHRVDSWFLMASWRPTLLVCFCYLISVALFTKWMRKRDQFEIRGLMISYNVALVILSAYIFMSLIYYGLQAGFNVGCWPVDSRMNTATMGLACAFWLYYFSKIIELMDTMFFIARKKFNLLSLLHIYHHMSIPALSWLTVRYAPGGLMTITFILNCFVHIFMYTYYALAAAGTKYQKYIWWKKYVTVMQMIQFVIMICHSSYILSIKCSYPPTLVWLTLVNASIFLLLFVNYFITSRKPSGQCHKSE